MGGYYGSGTVWGLSKSATTWTEKLPYQFSGSDGWEHMGIAVPKELNATSPVFATSFRGGHGNGASIALKPNTSGAWTALTAHSFAGKPDGLGPLGPVFEDASGDLYGTTCCGGAYGFGTVYRMQPTGSGFAESIVYSFRGGQDGDYPRGGLIDVNGVLYGITESGGGSMGDGTIFKLTPSGSGYTESVVYAFGGQPAGAVPYAGLCMGPDGALYGTTQQGGTYDYGTVFKYDPRGEGYAPSILWSFGNFGDGTNPWGSVIVDNNGVIYGTTISTRVYSGTSNGAFFALTPAGGGYKESLHVFTGYNGGAPESGPTADGKGNIYMATSAGGSHFFGVVAKAKGAAGGADCDPGSVTQSE